MRSIRSGLGSLLLLARTLAALPPPPCTRAFAFAAGTATASARTVPPRLPAAAPSSSPASTSASAVAYAAPASAPASHAHSHTSSSASTAAADSVVHVSCTINNILVSVSTLDGNVISRCSGGMLGLRHRQRASGSAATDIARQACQKAVEAGFKVAHVHLKGPSRSRGQALRGIQGGGMRIADIRDVTPTPTNGCRPKAARRL